MLCVRRAGSLGGRPCMVDTKQTDRQAGRQAAGQTNRQPERGEVGGGSG